MYLFEMATSINHELQSINIYVRICFIPLFFLFFLHFKFFKELRVTLSRKKIIIRNNEGSIKTIFHNMLTQVWYFICNTGMYDFHTQMNHHRIQYA